MKSFFVRFSIDFFLSTHDLNDFFSRWSIAWKNRVFLTIFASTCLLDEDDVCDEDIVCWLNKKVNIDEEKITSGYELMSSTVPVYFLGNDRLTSFVDTMTSLSGYIDIIRWYDDITLRIHWHHSSNTLTPASQIRKESCKKLCYLTCSLYSQRANHMISKKVAKFIKLIKRFRNLQGWLKRATFDVIIKSEIRAFLKLFQKFKVLMFLDERTLKKLSKLSVRR
jgi:hypothetical protein